MRRKLFKYVAVWCLIMLTLSGCAKSLVATDFCNLYKPVYTSSKDTEQTRTDVDGNNAVFMELCLDGK